MNDPMTAALKPARHIIGTDSTLPRVYVGSYLCEPNGRPVDYMKHGRSAWDTFSHVGRALTIEWAGGELLLWWFASVKKAR